MPLSSLIIDCINDRFGQHFGRRIDRAADFYVLSQHIFEVTHQQLSVNTLKRLFGRIQGVKATVTTLNIIANYLGYEDYAVLCKSLFSVNSGFNVPSGVVYPSELTTGTLLEVTYHPDRLLRLEVMDDHRLRVIAAHNTKLLTGDLLTVPLIELHRPFVARSVERKGQQLPSYTGGISGGVTSMQEFMGGNF